MKSFAANRFIPNKYLALSLILALIGAGAAWLATPGAPALARGGARYPHPAPAGGSP